jgi:hypothetical protein
MYKTKTHAKCKTPCSLHHTEYYFKNTDQIVEYVHSAGCLQSIMVNSKFSVVGGKKNGTLPKNMAECLVKTITGRSCFT